MATLTCIVKGILRGSVPLIALCLGASVNVGAADGLPEGVAVAIVYDTSGSMLQNARDAQGKSVPKHVIAHRAVGAVIDRLQAVAAGSENSRVSLYAGLVVFRGTATPFAVKFGPFDPQRFRAWLSDPDKPQAGTPLGEAVRVAGEAVLKSELPRKHVLVITDGVNTKGPDPTRTIPKLQKDAADRESRISFHFVAFDVNARVFDGVKKLGATVVGASDEKELNSQLGFILEKKILLEDEELPTATPKTN